MTETYSGNPLIVLLDASESAYPEGPYVADVTFRRANQDEYTDSTGYIICEHADLGDEEVRCYDNVGHFATACAGDVAEILTVDEIRDRILGAE